MPNAPHLPRTHRISSSPRVPPTIEPAGAADWIAAARRAEPDPAAPRKRPHEYTKGESAARRANVAQLLTWGYSAGKISRTLNIPYATVSDDVKRIRTQLQLDALPSLYQRLLQSIAVYKQVQLSAWEAHYLATDDNANKVNALKVVMAAQVRIDLLEGTTAPEKISAAAVAEVQEMILWTLGEVGGTKLQLAFLEALHQRTHAGMNRLLISGQRVPGLKK